MLVMICKQIRLELAKLGAQFELVREIPGFTRIKPRRKTCINFTNHWGWLNQVMI